jgi:uncharacterized protein
MVNPAGLMIGSALFAVVEGTLGSLQLAAQATLQCATSTFSERLPHRFRCIAMRHLAWHERTGLGGRIMVRSNPAGYPFFPVRTMNILTLDALRSLYAPARERSVKKELTRLDVHCQRFIALSPFVVIASDGAKGAMDASPRGGEPGFVKMIGNGTLLIPDSPGNNRLDTLENIIETGRVGLLFLLPGMDESLRVNGRAVLSTDSADLALFTGTRHQPKLVVRVAVEAAYLHCAKALMRSGLWNEARHVERSVMPSMGEMMKDQIGGDIPAETQAEMLVRYAQDL